MQKINSLPHYIIPIFVPHLGCPHDCIFCNQKRITNMSTDVKELDVKNKIEEYLSYFDKDAFIEIAFYGGSFTAIDLDIQAKLLQLAYSYKKAGKIDAIRLSTRPDAIDRERLDLLKKYDVDTVELGVQSLDREVLVKSTRGHSAESVYKAVELLKNYGFAYGLQMMLGLPGDDIYKDIYTAKEFIKLDPDCVRIYPTLVIKDTHLEKDYYSGKYEALNLEEAIEISTILLLLFSLNDINVIRVGLQVTENIQMGEDVLAGPFHPAFRQLVEANILREILDREFMKYNNSLENEEITIESPTKFISNIIGHKASNKKYFIKKYSFKKIKIKEIEELDYINILFNKARKSIEVKIEEARKALLEEELSKIAF